VESRWLRVKDVGTFNLALLVKWKWRLGLEERGVWRDILKSRYGKWREMSRTMVDTKSSY